MHSVVTSAARANRHRVSVSNAYFRSIAFLVVCLVMCPRSMAIRLESSPVTPVEQHYTSTWAVEIQGGPGIARNIARKHGFLYVGEIMPDFYAFRKPRLQARSLGANKLTKNRFQHDTRVLWSEQQVAKRRVKRDLVFNDPGWPKMWYLQKGGYSGLDMNVQSVWERGFAGQGVTVTILDDGLERDHPDIRENYSREASFDFNANDDDPTPKYDVRDPKSPNRHGTRCAGVVSAVANNSLCGMGIAYRAKVGAIRMLDGDVTDMMESQSLNFAHQVVDIYSASWGPEDDGKTVDGPGRLAKRAFQTGVEKGRNGLGSIFVWANGNGGKLHDNCNCDGYTNSIYTLSVSSVTQVGSIPWYAEKCASTMAVTFSSGSSGELGVITTDLNHTCTDTHSGTSASAPMAAAICALALSANPKLTWRDMQYLVVYTARPEGLFAAKWHVNGVKRRVSHAFGYGLMDADAMVRMAVNWTSVPAQSKCELVTTMSNKSINENQSVEFKIRSDGCQSSARGNTSAMVFHLEHVISKISLSSKRRGETQIYLTSPSGTVSNLLDKRPHDLTLESFFSWPFMSVHFWGESSVGEWTLTVHANAGELSISKWSLVLYGTYDQPVRAGRSVAPHSIKPQLKRDNSSRNLPHQQLPATSKPVIPAGSNDKMNTLAYPSTTSTASTSKQDSLVLAPVEESNPKSDQHKEQRQAITVKPKSGVSRQDSLLLLWLAVLLAGAAAERFLIFP